MEEIESAPAKRGRGRPKGSLNKKTIARMSDNEEEQAPIPFTLDVDFESNEILGDPEPVPDPEPEPEPEPVRPKLKRAVSRKTRIPDPPPVSAEESEDETPPPKPKRVRRTPKPAAAPQPPPVAQPPLTYLEVLTRGLRAAQATQKAEKVARYDAFFAR